jgi:hypothetical protein
MQNNIFFIVERGRGWGFQEAQLTYDLHLDMLVLPCSWFDPTWIHVPQTHNTGLIFDDTDQHYDFDNFHKGCFCFHWHNHWNTTVGNNSIIKRLINKIQDNL